MPQNPEVHLLFRPVNGAALAVKTQDFRSLDHALGSLTEGLGQGRIFRFTVDAADTAESTFVLVNLSHIAAVRVSAEPGKGADDGQYL